MVTAEASASAWSDTAAADALQAHRGSRLPVTGDLVTLVHDAGSFVETRIWKGSGWDVAGQQLNGNTLISGTVAADALLLDGINVGANPATGAIQIRHLVSPRITLPTESGDPFHTIAVDRALVAEKRISQQNQVVIFGGLQVNRDAFHVSHNQTSTAVLMAYDRDGMDDSEQTNNEYTRFFFRQPTFTLDMHVTMADHANLHQIAGIAVKMELLHGAELAALRGFGGNVSAGVDVRSLLSGARQIDTGQRIGRLEIDSRLHSPSAAGTGHLTGSQQRLATMAMTYRPANYDRWPIRARMLWVRATLRLTGVRNRNAASALYRALSESMTFAGGTLR